MLRLVDHLGEHDKGLVDVNALVGGRFHHNDLSLVLLPGADFLRFPDVRIAGVVVLRGNQHDRLLVLQDIVDDVRHELDLLLDRSVRHNADIKHAHESIYYEPPFRQYDLLELVLQPQLVLANVLELLLRAQPNGRTPLRVRLPHLSHLKRLKGGIIHELGLLDHAEVVLNALVGRLACVSPPQKVVIVDNSAAKVGLLREGMLVKYKEKLYYQTLKDLGEFNLSTVKRTKIHQHEGW